MPSGIAREPLPSLARSKSKNIKSDYSLALDPFHGQNLCATLILTSENCPFEYGSRDTKDATVGVVRVKPKGR